MKCQLCATATATLPPDVPLDVMDAYTMWNGKPVCVDRFVGMLSYGQPLSTNQMRDNLVGEETPSQRMAVINRYKKYVRAVQSLRIMHTPIDGVCVLETVGGKENNGCQSRELKQSAG